MEKEIEYKKLSLEDNLQGVIKLMKVFPEDYSKEINSRLTIESKGPYGIWVARKNLQKDVGFSIWYTENKDEAYFWLTAVAKEYGKNGVGAKLLDLAIQDISDLKFPRMLLNTFESCEGMKKLCKQRNFREIKREPCPWNTPDDIHIEYVLDLKNYKRNI